MIYTLCKGSIYVTGKIIMTVYFLYIDEVYFEHLYMVEKILENRSKVIGNESEIILNYTKHRHVPLTRFSANGKTFENRTNYRVIIDSFRNYLKV